MVEPILMSVATALATKAASGALDSLRDLVRKAVARRPKEDQAVVAEVVRAAPELPADSPAITRLAELLARVQADDPAFGPALQAAWTKVEVAQHADHGGVVNQITGNVTGRVLQARDIHGNVSF